VLGVDRSADGPDLRRAYLDLARRHHPDVAGGDPSRMRAVNEAWATLGDPVRRARYDRVLGGDATGPTPGAGDGDLDDTPWGGRVVLPQWLSLLPVGTFATSVVTFCVGLVMTSEPLLGLALVSFVLSCLFFLAAPFVALLASRLRNG
jgi:hypothetical protein